MGRGVISDGGTDGQYTISLDYGEDIADSIIAQLTAQAAALESDIDALEAEIALLEISQASLQLLLSASITTYNASEKTDADKETLAQVSASVSSGDQYLQRKNAKLAVKRLTLANTENRISFLQGKAFTETRTVWCADLTEDGTGAVDTIEINGEQGPLILIAPGAPEYSSSAGYLRSRYAMTPEQAFFNAAILPGVQKFKPTFRVGSISDIDYENDTCTVTLDSATSSAQSLSINQASILTGIPVEYMTCHAGAFEDGDDVVVQFEGQSWDDPKVIGFKTNPKSCTPAQIAFLVEGSLDLTYTVGTGPPYPYAASMHATEGEPPVIDFPGTYPGLYTVTDTYPLTGEGLPFPPPGGLNRDHTDCRIRFDHAFFRQREDDPYFDDELVSDVEESTFGTDYVVECIGSNDLTISIGNNIIFTRDDTGMTTDTWDGVGGPYTVLVGPVVATSYYNYYFDTSQHIADAIAYDTYARQFWDPPPTITLVINSKEHTYTLETFGPQIPVQNYNTTFLKTPYGGGPPDVSQFKSHIWVVYSRV